MLQLIKMAMETLSEEGNLSLFMTILLPKITGGQKKIAFYTLFTKLEKLFASNKYYTLFVHMHGMHVASRCIYV